MTKAQADRLRRRAAAASGEKLRALYLEVLGAEFAGSVTEERARASIVEALDEEVGLTSAARCGTNSPQEET